MGFESTRAGEAGTGASGVARARLLIALCGLAALALFAGQARAAASPAFDPGPVVEPGAETVPPAETEIDLQEADHGIHISALRKKSVPGPSKKNGTFIAKLLVPSPVLNRPGRGRIVWRAATRTKWSGSGQRLMVLNSAEARGKTWLKVRLPGRPNGASGWILRDRVRLVRTRKFLLLDNSRRLLRIYRKGRVVSRIKVVVGAPSTPTPRGLFALYDEVPQPDPNGFVGPWIIILTAHSNVLRRFYGGPGLVALHGRAGASFSDPLGSARSHGCVRMNNSRLREVMRVPMGTAIKIQN